MGIKAEIIKDTENIRCLVNIEGLTIDQCVLLARDHLADAMRYLSAGEFNPAISAILETMDMAEICLRANSQEEEWIESLPDTESDNGY